MSGGRAKIGRAKNINKVFGTEGLLQLFILPICRIKIWSRSRFERLARLGVCESGNLGEGVSERVSERVRE